MDVVNAVRHDFCVVGGGIVGLATARQLQRQRPGASVVVLDKERALAVHQTGHNSGVIHSGIYYEPGSLTARLCMVGAQLTRELAARHGIPINTCGKLLVATTPAELTAMDALEQRAAINDIGVERLDAAELARRESAVRGLGALFVAQTGIVDYRRVADALAGEIRDAGGTIETGVEVVRLAESPSHVEVVTSSGRTWTASQVAACAGLQSDRLARRSGVAVDFRIVPFRGEYYRLAARWNDALRHLVYPIPDPSLPFLGIHLTRTVDGGVTVGPSAVLGLSREGYRKGSVALRDVADYARFPGMWRVARRYAATGVREVRNSLSKRAYLAQCRRYCPDLTLDDLLPEPAGIRAQAVARDGTLVHDFLFAATPRTLHVCNAPSPAATAALPIGAHIAQRLSSP